MRDRRPLRVAIESIDPMVERRELASRCATCARQRDCAPTGLRTDYPRCHAPVLRTSLARTSALFARMAELAHVPPPRAEAVGRIVLDRFALDRERLSEVLEPSLSGTAEHHHTFRFSYGFPRFAREPRAIAATFSALGAVLSDSARRAAMQLLAATRSPAVEQPILGYAAGARPDGKDDVLKLYLQFHANMDSAARELSARVLGGDAGLGSLDGSLHLLGLDVGAHGLRRAKVYLLHPRMHWPRLAKTMDLAEELFPSETIANALSIYEITEPGARVASTPDTVDFGLIDQDMLLSTLAPALTKRFGAAMNAWRALSGAFDLSVRRVSYGRKHSLHLYYMLTESDGEAAGGQR